MSNYIYMPFWIDVMANVRDNDNISQVTKIVDGTYPMTSYVLHEFEGMKLLTIKKIGRMSCVYLTEDGKKFRDICVILIHLAKLKRRSRLGRRENVEEN